MQTLEGTRLGNYDVMRRIRVGGMGAVYEGRQRTAFGRQVAIKVILGNYASDREMRRRFAREARTIAQLHHPHILPLIEFGDEHGLLYLVMPFIEGGTLTGYLRRELPDLQDIASIFLQLLDAVEYAHEEGLIHRDIKSSNVLLDARRGGKPYVYLADFGLVRTSQSLEPDEIGKPIPLDQVPGTPHYMAPEQTRGVVTQASDIYALGVLLFQMLTGELPYDDQDEVEVIKMHLYSPVPSPCERDASIPVEVGEVARKAMAKRPEQRFASITEMRQAFLAAMEGPAIHTTEDDPEIELIVSDPLEPLEPLPPLHSQQQRRPQLPQQRPQVALPRRAAQARPQQAPRHPSAPLAQIDLPQETVARAPELTVTRQRRGAAPAPSVPLVSRASHRETSRARHGRRFALTITAATLVPILLILLLVLPRALGLYLFPSSFPVIGAPVATISVTVKSQTIANSYLLKASPAVAQPDVATHALPDRPLTAEARGSSAEATSGTRTIAGKQASGLISFDNNSHQSFFVQQGTEFTASTGVVVILSQSVNIPPRSDGGDGTVSAPAIAAEAGAKGNIPAMALYSACCNGPVFVSNPQPFSGGVDARVVHVVTQADLDSARKAMSPGLQKQALQQLQSRLAAGQVEVGQPSFSTQVTSDKTVGTQADTVNVQVQVTARVTAYSQEVARQVAEELLIRQAGQQLGNNYQLKDTLIVEQPVVTSQEKQGVIYLTVTAHGLWVYHLTEQQLNQWRQAIKGATPQLAQAYVTSQAGVQSVKIQLPFAADHLPSSLDQIQIVLVNV